MIAFPEPGRTADLRGLLLTYLDFYRGVITTKMNGLNETELHTSNVLSGWTIAGLLNHLIHMERRWLHWGFAAEHVAHPWSDSNRAESNRADSTDGTGNGVGWVNPGVSVENLLKEFEAVAAHTRQIVEQHQLTDLAAAGGRFTNPDATPQLQWILLHVLQEYARHAGHLDISRELIDGSVGKES